MKDLEWFRALGFACIVLCAAPMVVTGQTNGDKNHGGTSNHETVLRRTPAAVTQKPSVAATTPKVTTTVPVQPLATVSGPPAAPKSQPQSGSQGSSGGLLFIEAPPQGGQAPQQQPATTGTSPHTQRPGSTGNGNQQQPVGTQSEVPPSVVSTHSQPKGQPQGTRTQPSQPATVHGQIPLLPVQTYQGTTTNGQRQPSQLAPSIGRVVPPPTVQPNRAPSTLSPQPSSPSQPTPPPSALPQTSHPQTPSTEQHLGSLPSGDTIPREPSPQPITRPSMPALMLTQKTDKPVAGKEVVVEAALTPQPDGVTYQLDWGDGSALESVRAPGLAGHRYAAAKTYTVSASTNVDGSHLYHQILLQVAPVVWPRVLSALALAGMLPFLGWHLAKLLLSATFRAGAPGVPEIRLLGKEPYVSLSFEPSAGPAEGRITFTRLRQKTG